MSDIRLAGLETDLQNLSSDRPEIRYTDIRFSLNDYHLPLHTSNAAHNKQTETKRSNQPTNQTCAFKVVQSKIYAHYRVKKTNLRVTNKDLHHE